jgi:DUF4097 and DUF4098 domain-containing protein YvlB
MKAMKSLFTLALLAVAGGACAQHDDGKPYLTKSFPAGGIKNVRVETSGGGIAVNGQNGGEARIEMYVRSNRGRELADADIKERLEKDYDITLEKNGDALVARAKRRRNGDWDNALSISFKVFPPTNVSTDLQTSGGGIKLADLNGTQKAETSGGGIDLRNIKGNAAVETSGGGIKVENFDGKLDAVTSGGGIDATGNLGDSRLVTSGGGIKLNAVSGNVEAETSGGGITAEIRKLGKRLSLSTSGGSIDVKMPMDQGMDLDLQGDKVQVAMNNFDGVVEDDHVRGKLNGGGIPVRMSTSGGRVKIN